MGESARYSNIKMLQFVATKLDDLRDEVVFLGGCTTGLFITDSMVPDVRPTLDVDCIVDVMSKGEYYKIDKRLKNLGFKQKNDMICRWHFDEIILDVMPTDASILGFSNRWYKEAINFAQDYRLMDNLSIKVVTAPYLIATKFEAFASRGKSDYILSHDFEDIITILDGRSEIIEEINTSSTNIKKYLVESLNQVLDDQMFFDALPGHMNQYGRLHKERSDMVLQKIHAIVDKNV